MLQQWGSPQTVSCCAQGSAGTVAARIKNPAQFPQGKVKITTYLLRLSFELRLNMHLIVLNLQESAAILRSTKEQCRNIDSNSMLLMWENFRFPNYPKLSGRPNAMAGMRGNGSTVFPKLPPELCSDMLRISSALLMLQ